MSTRTGCTTRKNTTAATITKVMMSCSRTPYWKTPCPMVNCSPAKGRKFLPGMAKIDRIRLTVSLMITPKKVAMTTATARSTTLPFRTKSLNSASRLCFSFIPHHTSPVGPIGRQGRECSDARVAGHQTGRRAVGGQNSTPERPG